ALLGRDDRRHRRRGLRLAAHGYAGRLGTGGGHAMSRILDLAIASVLLVLASPILMAALVAVRLESPGSPIYKQRRVGKNGQPFELYKIRTMVTGAEHIGAGLAVNERDTRVPRAGDLLRRFPLAARPNLV